MRILPQARGLARTLLAAAALAATPLFAAVDPATMDFDGNNRSDVVWRHVANGSVYRFSVNGLALAAGGLVHVESDLRWKIVAEGDFNADGRSDLLWRHDSDGRLYVMTMGATGAPSGGAVIHAEPNRDWRIAQVADLDGDAKADIVWWNATNGQVWLQLMDGLAIKSQGMLHTEADTNWRIVGAGAFLPGVAEQLVWHHRTDGIVYRMALTSATQPFTKAWEVIGSDPDDAWIVHATGDFDGNGTSDLLWRNVDTGGVRVALTGGASSIVHTEADRNWRIVAVGDYNGDARTDLLWRNFANGAVYLMHMNGTSIASGGQVYLEGDQRWRILGENDFADNDWTTTANDAVAAAFYIDARKGPVPASCEGSFRINCLGRTPAPTPLSTTLSNVNGTTTSLTYELAFNAPGVVVEDTSASLSCTVNFNSGLGTTPRILVGSQVQMYASNSGGPNDRLYMQTTSPQIEAGDFTTSCTGTSAYLANIARFYFQNHLGFRFTGVLCGAPGRDVFGACP